MPDTGAGISVSTLSVEISSSGSSAVMVSPTCFNQRVTVPSVTLSPSCGIVTETDIVTRLLFRDPGKDLFVLIKRVRVAACQQERGVPRPLLRFALGERE